MDKGSQTNIFDFERTSNEFDFDIETIKVNEGFKAVDDLNDDVTTTQWAEDVVKQLYVRDVLFTFIFTKFQNLMKHCKNIECDVDYMQLKKIELEEDIKKLKKKVRLKKQKKFSHSSQSIQTEGDWAKFYDWYINYSSTYHNQERVPNINYENYAYTNYMSNNSYANYIENDVSSLLIGTDTVGSKTDNGNEKEDKLNVYGENYNKSLDNKEENSNYEPIEGDTNNVDDGGTIDDKMDEDKHSKIEKITTTDTDDITTKISATSPDSELINETPCTLDKNHDYLMNNNENSIRKMNINDLPKSEEISSQMDTDDPSSKENNTTESNTETFNDALKPEDVVKSITEAANEMVAHSSYVYNEENGHYYDYTTGYYYDAENGLYYDANSRIYFYYDHNTQSYVFHSQLPPEQTNKIEEKTFEEAPDSEVEEGEYVSSEDETPQPLVPEVSIAPSLRLMVTDSGGSESVREGYLHLITLDCGSVGRDKTNHVHLPDMSLSKDHAKFIYHSSGPDDHHYFIKDLGSNNGTFVNGKRLSECKKLSHPFEIGHGWKIKFGRITLTCHIHPGNLTCKECEPGLVPRKKKNMRFPKKKRPDKEKARKSTARQLRKKYGLAGSGGCVPSQDRSNYVDRAEVRRELVGSDNPYEKAEVASVDLPISEENKGFKLLKQMGWKEGSKLGINSDGIATPIQVKPVLNREGLGATPEVVLTKKQKKRKRIQKITKERFDNLKERFEEIKDLEEM